MMRVDVEVGACVNLSWGWLGSCRPSADGPCSAAADLKAAPGQPEGLLVLLWARGRAPQEGTRNLLLNAVVPSQIEMPLGLSGNIQINSQSNKTVKRIVFGQKTCVDLSKGQQTWINLWFIWCKTPWFWLDFSKNLKWNHFIEIERKWLIDPLSESSLQGKGKGGANAYIGNTRPCLSPWEGGEVLTDPVGSLGKAKPDRDGVYKFLSEK